MRRGRRYQGIGVAMFGSACLRRAICDRHACHVPYSGSERVPLGRARPRVGEADDCVGAASGGTSHASKAVGSVPGVARQAPTSDTSPRADECRQSVVGGSSPIGGACAEPFEREAVRRPRAGAFLVGGRAVEARTTSSTGGSLAGGRSVSGSARWSGQERRRRRRGCRRIYDADVLRHTGITELSATSSRPAVHP